MIQRKDSLKPISALIKVLLKVNNRVTGIQLLNKKETLKYVLNNNLSLVRYGDGDISLTFLTGRPGYKGVFFQKADKLLAEKLQDALFSPIDNLLVTIEITFMHTSEQYVILNYERSPKKYKRYLSIFSENDIGILHDWKTRRFQLFYIYYFFKILRRSSVTVFGDARCFFASYFWPEYCRNQMSEIFNLYKSFFADRRVLFVSPEEPLIGVSFRTLVNNGIIKSIKEAYFISVPNNNAFGQYDIILKKILKFKNIDAVFLQCGPTATVMAAELTKNYGRLAYDVGSFNTALLKAAQVHGITF